LSFACPDSLSHQLWAALLALVSAPAAADEPVTVRGQVLGLDGAPVDGAAIDVLRGVPRCAPAEAAVTAVHCPLRGNRPTQHSCLARRGERPGDRALPTRRRAHRSTSPFVLIPQAPTAVAPVRSEGDSWLLAPLPNSVVFQAGGRPVTRRAAGVAVAIVAVALVLLCVLVLGPRFGWKRRRLSTKEVGDLVFNDSRAPLSERVHPVAVVGAVGVEWSLSLASTRSGP
jgi:hypothetical protein